ncbi:MAG TPA: hypothetical protein VKV04_01430 [Verrucomicrobiae bacterium]|nr:hypothetical protein [Verrucomicrobiae bacterium]
MAEKDVEPISQRKPMFVYRPPKGSCWGHALAKGPGRMKVQEFIDAYFERVESQGLTSLVLAWKSSVLPKVEWAEAFLGPENEIVRRFLFMERSGRVSFVMGIVFPLSTSDPASFEFLGRFSASAPFKMSAKHFMVGIVAGNGKFAWRKPDDEMIAKLEECIV